MKKKNIISYLLLSIVLLPPIFSGGLQAFQQYIRYTVSERLDTEEIVAISVPLTEVQWMEEGREIIVNGKMFDVKTYEEKEGYLLAKGVYDEHETAIVEILNHFSHEDQNSFLVRLLILTQTFVAVVTFFSTHKVMVRELKHIVSYIISALTFSLLPAFQPPRYQFS